ncbi:ras-related protein Rab-38 [Astyanax mexicanus]|uniref:Ras-related protein Rab n=2 Tax=Astyanax mexicanus TaxID=7994 RepID=A0A3B1J252_ASTMX|nr:ras-related protein Rab-38 [Astyanax mexicanus]XP_015461540.1 ras-related protein Rab-38 [Astyanax mexicanus]
MQQERLLKVLVIGDLGVGKTAIIKRYVHQVFSQHYRATIGVDFALKVLNWDHRTVIRLQLWDIAGQERYGNMTRVYYREAVGALVVFDMTRASTFQAVLKWKMDLDSKVALNNGRPVPAVLLANKCDQQKQGLCARLPKLDTFSRDHGFVGWYETSAKDNTNIDAAIMCLVENILASDVENTAVDSDPSLLVLPSFDYNLRERSGPGCSACSRRRSTPRDNSDF